MLRGSELPCEPPVRIPKSDPFSVKWMQQTELLKVLMTISNFLHFVARTLHYFRTFPL